MRRPPAILGLTWPLAFLLGACGDDRATGLVEPSIAGPAIEALAPLLPELLGHETDRLHRSCRRLIWLNPLLRFEGFEPKARGVRAMLPNIDELRAVHNLEAIGDLAKALAAGRSHDADPRRFL